MSDIKINDLTVFGELKRGISQLGQRMPGVVTNTNTSLESLKRDIAVDIKETEQEIEKQKKLASQAENNPNQGTSPGQDDPKAKLSKLNQKLGVLKNSLSSVDHLMIRSRQLKTKSDDILTSISKANQVLDSLEAVAREYLQLPASYTSGSNLTGGEVGKGYNSFSDIRLLGDTFHFTKGSQLGQMQIDNLERQANQNVTKGNKISIDKVSSLDFNLLEKNGYKIQQIGPNDFSAFKMINR
jgi:hypothetical protein